MSFSLPAGWGRSLGMRSELLVHQPGSVVEDHGEYLVMRTPAQPGYYWGNFLAFREAPGPGDVERWPALFAEAFAGEPRVKHLAFGWDDPAGALGCTAEFEARGYVVQEGVVLTARALRPPARPAEGLVVRTLESDDDWEAAVQCHVASRAEYHKLEPYTAFTRARMAESRAMAAAGLGAWFGGFLDGRLVGDLGIRMTGELGRYRSVGTHPGFRRRGVCGTLVHAAGCHAFERWGARELVIIAEPGAEGDRVYRSVGFEPVERFMGFFKMPDGDREA